MAEPKSFAVSSGTFSKRGRLTGQHAAVWKYDLLTALSVYALGQGASFQTSILRLIAAVTARYDWRRDELSIGRKELTSLWQCSEPTVKRELRRLRGAGLLVTLRAGVRGRVAAYRLCRQAIEDMTRDHWACAGADFADRMGAPVESGNVVSFPGPSEPDEENRPVPAWADVACGGDPVIYRNWFSGVTVRREGDVAVFRAPSSFIGRQIETRFMRQVLEAARYQWPDIVQIRIESD